MRTTSPPATALRPPDRYRALPAPSASDALRLEGSLSWRGRRRFHKHLKGCPHCTHYLAQMRQVIETMGELPEEKIPQAALDDLLVTFRDWNRPRSPA